MHAEDERRAWHWKVHGAPCRALPAAFRHGSGQAPEPRGVAWQHPVRWQRGRWEGLEKRMCWASGAGRFPGETDTNAPGRFQELYRVLLMVKLEEAAAFSKWEFLLMGFDGVSLRITTTAGELNQLTLWDG